MTENESIDVLKNLAFLSTEREHEKCEKAIYMAIQALEKQIPKRPYCIEDKMWCCPICDNNLLHKWIKYHTKIMPKSEGLPHCMSCGQAIDWSE